MTMTPVGYIATSMKIFGSPYAYHGLTKVETPDKSWDRHYQNSVYSNVDWHFDILIWIFKNYINNFSSDVKISFN